MDYGIRLVSREHEHPGILAHLFRRLESERARFTDRDDSFRGRD